MPAGLRPGLQGGQDMPLVVPSLGLAYFPVPKNACTSLKEFFYEILESTPFEPSLGHVPPQRASQPLPLGIGGRRVVPVRHRTRPLRPCRTR